jgi:hypothetical protein
MLVSIHIGPLEHLPTVVRFVVRTIINPLVCRYIDRTVPAKGKGGARHREYSLAFSGRLRIMIYDQLDQYAERLP